MWDSLKRHFITSTDEILGIDIGTGSIKLAEVSWKKGQPLLRNIGFCPLPEAVVAEGTIMQEDTVVSLLRQLLATFPLQGQQVVASIGGRAMFAREILFPSMTITELKEAIQWDIEEYIPYPPDTYYYDCSIIEAPAPEATEMKVLLVASPTKAIDALVRTLKQCGLKVLAIDVEPLALYRTLERAENSLVIDMGAQLSQVTLFQQGSPVVIRNIPIGGQRFTDIVAQVLEVSMDEAEQLKQQHVSLLPPTTFKGELTALQQQISLLVAEFARDIRRTFEYYQIQNKQALIEHLFLTGGAAKIPFLQEHLAQQLEMTFVPYQPLQHLQIHPGLDPLHLEKQILQLGTAIGLALRGKDNS